MRTIINSIPRHDDSGGVPSSGNLPIFSYYRWPLLKNIVLRRYMIDIEFKQTDNYMLFNYDEWDLLLSKKFYNFVVLNHF
jgi:hypothetical protein